ncbi:MAG: helix-turn-helix transcriptional regulator [Dyadobacter sp.]|uniref:helix-turn-helix domain-containing protein n=1 Tax=Dyadobacter sp. TaxID=1914288 RepID=UPI003265E881
MANKQQPAVMTAYDVREIIRKGALKSELEMERAVWAERSLRLISKDQPELDSLRKEVRNLIIQYESVHWSDVELVTDQQVRESESAEKRVKKEFKFFQKRKELILKKLKKYKLNQNDLGEILAHGKSYISELLNGTRSFSMNDLVIIHRLFDISLEDLICIEISADVEKRIKATLEKAAANSSKSKNPSQVSSLVKALYSKNAFPPNESLYEFPS